MKFENTSVFNLENALRGMRNPMNSWSKNDTTGNNIGENDLTLASKLIKAGPEHRKFLRQIFVSVDISAPRYWWSEFDTYKVGTVANSCSTMHKLNSKELTLDDFDISQEDLELFSVGAFSNILTGLNMLREKYNSTKEFKYIIAMKKILPESFIQKRTVTLNYEVLLNMYRQRCSHRLPQWKRDFCDWVKTLPNCELILN